LFNETLISFIFVLLNSPFWKSYL